MRIGQIGAASYGAQVRRKNRSASADADKTEKKSEKRFVREDTFTPSTPTGKAESIDEVKKRVKNGFYNSDAVNEDLTDVFAKLFNR